MYLLQKCLLLACVFMLCPKRSSFTSLSGRIRNVYKPDPYEIIKYPSRINNDLNLLKKSSIKINQLINERDAPKKLNSAKKMEINKNNGKTKELNFVEESEANNNAENDEKASNVTKDPSNDEDRPTELRAVEKKEPGFSFTDEEITKFKIWPRGIIPYFIDDFSFDKVLRDSIRGFLDSVNSASGLNFIELPRPPTDDSRWLFLINRRGQLECADISTRNFSNSGVQKLLLGYNCMSCCTAMAEVILAIAGVPPQHNAPNRDEYVQVQTENILPDKKHLFDILKDDEWLFHDIDYDFDSAGHYDFHKYTVNGAATLKPVKTVNIPVGEGDGFSNTDIWKIQMLYNYISRQKLTDAPKCSKLFKLGNKFSSYKPKSDNEVQPRKKPNKYLGLPDDAPEELSEKVNDKENGEDDNNKNEKNDTNNKEGDLDDNDNKTIQLLNESRNKKNMQVKDKKRNEKKLKDPFNRSDYETQEKK